MRVISGTARGTKLQSIEGLATRPTTDRVKEALFSMINHEIIGSRCLDLYAGSGALGIELLSRGAKSVIFVEKSVKSEKIIGENLKKTKLENGSRRLIKEVDKALMMLKGERYDIIVMDPPYNAGEIKKVLELIASEDLLESEGLVVIEHEINDPDLDHVEVYYEWIKTKKYGKTGITLLRRQHENSSLPG
ncbi:MAG: 16S rRNA (guanine(966)-N(2))-methyltransferase RsmD [Bacillota bacterium]|nr:16S rRNA (guanine(966)-N(2))-methyltransferase RsmD [Bacillota bacterium]